MSNANVKNKLVNTMKMTKAGTAKTTTATEKKDQPATTAGNKTTKKTAPRKKAATKSSATGFSSGACRVWPD